MARVNGMGWDGCVIGEKIQRRENGGGPAGCVLNVCPSAFLPQVYYVVISEAIT